MQLFQGKQGLFEMELVGSLAKHGPDAVKGRQYDLGVPKTFSTKKRDMAAARFIYECATAGGWCGVRLLDLYEKIEREMNKERDSVLHGILDLKSAGLLRSEYTSENHEVLFPTPEFVERILG